MRVFKFQNIDSTQEYIKEVVRSGEIDRVALAEEQSGGHGRNGHSWESPVGGLWFSFARSLNGLTNEEISLLTLVVGLAVRDACQAEYDCKVQIKWPNDIILCNKKAGGIICESFANYVVIGVGLNTNIVDTALIPESGISFVKETGKRISNEYLMNKIIENVEEYITLLLDKKENIIKTFRENMAYIGEEIYISSIGEMAVIEGINDYGHLIVNDGNTKKEVFTGEVLIDKKEK